MYEEIPSCNMSLAHVLPSNRETVEWHVKDSFGNAPTWAWLVLAQAK